MFLSNGALKMGFIPRLDLIVCDTGLDTQKFVPSFIPLTRL